MDLNAIDGIIIDNEESTGDATALEVIQPVAGDKPTTEESSPLSINRDKFRTLTECIGLMQFLPCNDCDIKQGMIRQNDNYRNTIIELDLTDILGTKSLAISNTKEKYSVMKALDVDDSVDWANEDLTLTEIDKFYEIIDKESTVRFRKPVDELMGNSFISKDALNTRVDTADERLIFNIDIKPFMVKRVKSMCESMSTEYITLNLEDTKGNISVKSRNTSEELSATAINDFDLEKKIPASEFTISALPFKISSGSDLIFKFYKQKQHYLMVFEQVLFGSIKFRIYGRVQLKN